MRARTANWFETNIKYDKKLDDDRLKEVKESYLVDALSCTEAENTITEQMSMCISGEFNVMGIKNAKYREVLFSDVATDDYWFKAKLEFVTIDEKTEKEKKSSFQYLVQAHSLQQAVKYIDDFMSKGMEAYTIVNVSRSSYLDVFEHDLKSNNAPVNDVPEYEQVAK